MQKEYEVEWSKTYYRSGTETITANSLEEAERLARMKIGDWEGSSQYDPDQDQIDIKRFRYPSMQQENKWLQLSKNVSEVE